MTFITLDQKFFTEPLLERAEAYQPRVCKALADLQQGDCLGHDFTGWYQYPQKAGFKEIGEISHYVKELDVDYDIVVVVGIGGSYLGTRAVADALSHSYTGMVQESLGGFRKPIVYAGHHLSESESLELLDLLDQKHPIVNVISKSGTTTEPGIAFRVLRDYMNRRFGASAARDRIVVTTDPEKGSLRKLAEETEYVTFAIPPEVGGRFSVLTPVGMVPLALAGFDVQSMMQGADRVFRELGEFQGDRAWQHPVLNYAKSRMAAYDAGKKVEVLAFSDPKLRSLVEWWKQLFGESEGKDGKGLFPSGLAYTTDLHSMGQFMQAGERILLETFLTFSEDTYSSSKAGERRLKVPTAKDNFDGLGYLENRYIADVNAAAVKGTKLAHYDGGVPCLEVRVRRKTEESLGGLIGFFESACALSGAMLGVNPYDQPGVEDYKVNLFALLGKPGFEQLASDLRQRF